MNGYNAMRCSKTEMEWRIVSKYGRKFLEGRYVNEEWSGWLFLFDVKKHDGWIWMPEFGAYRRNTSIN